MNYWDGRHNMIVKVRLSPYKKVGFIYFNGRASKIMKKYFLFYVKSSFRFKDI